MGYDNSELTRKWNEVKRHTWLDNQFCADIAAIQKDVMDVVKQSQECANEKLRKLEEAYDQERKKVLEELYAEQKELNDSCIMMASEMYDKIPKKEKSKSKNDTSIRQMLLRIWAEQANCFYISSWNEMEDGLEMLEQGKIKGKKKNEVGRVAKGSVKDYEELYRKKLHEVFDIVMGQFWDEEKEEFVGAHELLYKNRRSKLTEENANFLQYIFRTYYGDKKDESIAGLIEQKKSSKITRVDRHYLRAGMQGLADNPNTRFTDVMVEMRWYDLFGSTKDEATREYEELCKDLRIIWELTLKSRNELVACRKVSQSLEECDEKIRHIISEYRLDPNTDYSKLDKEWDDLYKRMADRAAKNKKIVGK